MFKGESCIARETPKGRMIILMYATATLKSEESEMVAPAVSPSNDANT